MPAGFVDLHAHYLPGIDDGAGSLEIGVEMIQAVSALGFTVVHATPHQRAGMYLPSAQQIADAHAQLATALSELPSAPQVGLAAENFWDDVFHQRIREGGLPTYPGGRAFLFEVDPAMMPAAIEKVLFEIRLSRRLPVMAHPERYRSVQEDITRAETLGKTAALLVDLGALSGAYGRAQKKTGRRLIEEGLAHAVATDIHHPRDSAAVAEGMAWIRKNFGDATLDRLLADNTRCILAGEIPQTQ